MTIKNPPLPAKPNFIGSLMLLFTLAQERPTKSDHLRQATITYIKFVLQVEDPLRPLDT